MRTNALLAAAVVAALSMPAQADVLGLKVGLDVFNASSDGTYAGDVTNFSDDSHFSGYVAFEHPVPLLPNVMLRYNELDDSGNGRNLDLSNTDMIAYYELLDNAALELDIGANYRIYSGKANTIDDLSRDLDEGSLMAYVRGRFNLVGTGLFAYADIVAGNLDDKSISDYQIGAGYQLGFIPLLDMELKAGYREHRFDVSGFNGISADVTQDGWFAGVEVSF